MVVTEGVAGLTLEEGGGGVEVTKEGEKKEKKEEMQEKNTPAAAAAAAAAAVPTSRRCSPCSAAFTEQEVSAYSERVEIGTEQGQLLIRSQTDGAAKQHLDDL